MSDGHIGETVADPDGPVDHHDARFDFPPLAIALCWGGGAVAIILGIIFGLAMANN